MKNVYFKITNIILIIATLFMGIGYAAIESISLDITGNISTLNQGNIFITDYEYKTNNNANIDDSKIINIYQTLLKSSVSLSSTDPNSSITYSITLYNSGDVSLGYVDTYFNNDFYDNENIIFELENLTEETNIPPKGYHTFNITFKYKENVVPSEEINTLNSYLNFKFIRRIKSLDSTGTQYIDTGISPNNNTTFDMRFALSEIESVQAIYGTRYSMVTPPYHNLFMYTNNEDFEETVWQLRWDENQKQTFLDLYYNEGNIVDIKKDSKQLTVSTNGKSFSVDNPTGEWSINSNIYIFNQNQQETAESRTAKMKLYYLKIYQDGYLVKDFISALDNHGVASLFEKISGQYYYNVGEGEFEYTNSYTTLEYIESTGIQYIDTKTKGNLETTVEFMMKENEINNQTQGVFGGRADQNNQSFDMFIYQEKLRWDYNTTINNPTISTSLTNPTHIIANASKVIVNRTETSYGFTDSTNAEYNMYIFGVNNANNPIFLNTGMKLYYFKVYDNDTIVKNFIPVKDSNGTICLYEQISGEFYYNKGTGEFNSN